MATAFGQYQYTALRPVQEHGSATVTAAAAVSISAPESASMVLVQPIGANVRVKVDGLTAASTTAGFQVADGAAQFFPVASATTISIISEAGSATVQYQFFS
jgi:hypothetical protein